MKSGILLLSCHFGKLLCPRHTHIVYTFYVKFDPDNTFTWVRTSCRIRQFWTCSELFGRKNFFGLDKGQKAKKQSRTGSLIRELLPQSRLTYEFPVYTHTHFSESMLLLIWLAATVRRCRVLHTTCILLTIYTLASSYLVLGIIYEISRYLKFGYDHVF